MSVKRYEANGSSSVSEDANGSLVDYSDYAALEQKLVESQREFRAADATSENLQMQVDKLAAENAGLAAEVVAYADPQAFRNFQAGVARREWMWSSPGEDLIAVYTAPPAPLPTKE